jgi:hypothetical protein
MKEAALEVNHWCHEKVNYRGTDSRTSAPLSTISKTFGRCGEESTFTVASMRTVGIPARQVYTPRWAHTDDNHAWVEVWIDGAWHYMGACEPEAQLDRGWFSEPSQRTMLVHTRTYGRYFGPEEVMDAEDRFSELNLTSGYAKTKKVTVLVSNNDGTPAKDAKVEFKLYNYAEFYPLATIHTDQKGAASMTTGMGDLLVWASKEENYAFEKLNVPTTDTLHLVLSKGKAGIRTFNYDMIPPKTFKEITRPSEQEKKSNDLRLAYEDSVRNNYFSTFKDSVWIGNYAKTHGIAGDTLMRTIRLSYGNWKEIISYLENNQAVARKQIFSLINGISAKDLSDTKASVLTDHLTRTLVAGKPEGVTPEDFEKYIMAPRIDLELLSPWRSFLGKNLGNKMAEATRADINILISWINSNLRIDALANKHSRAPLTPIGVYNLRTTDPLSRDIFFVAACRTFNIPARLNPETRAPEYFRKGAWCRADFDARPIQPEMGQLSLKDRNNEITPQYTLHFTIARISNGRCQTLEFEEGKKLTDFPNQFPLETGNYLLVTGRRLSDGSVISSLTFFDITKEKTTSVDVTLRKKESTLKSLGKINPGEIILTDPINSQALTLASLMQKTNSVVFLLDPESEPSKHILNDMEPFIDQFNKWEGNFVFVSIAGKQGRSATFQSYRLPAKASFPTDAENRLGQALSELTGKDFKSSLPIVFFCQPDGNVLMISGGYKIGTGEQLLRLIKEVNSKNLLPGQPGCTVS